MHEPYRTLLGHFRHEIGHCFWDRLRDRSQLDACRALFGDDRQDYAQALQTYYNNGAPADWQSRFVSAGDRPRLRPSIASRADSWRRTHASVDFDPYRRPA